MSCKLYCLHYFFGKLCIHITLKNKHNFFFSKNKFYTALVLVKKMFYLTKIVIIHRTIKFS